MPWVTMNYRKAHFAHVERTTGRIVTCLSLKVSFGSQSSRQHLERCLFKESSSSMDSSVWSGPHLTQSRWRKRKRKGISLVCDVTVVFNGLLYISLKLLLLRSPFDKMRPIILEESTDRLTSLALTAPEQKSCHEETEIKLLSAEIPFPCCIIHYGTRSEIAAGEEFRL